jgi:long-chain acyl-CoA synthetase
VVPRQASDPDGLRRDLDAWCRLRLAVPERPRAITLGPSLPVTRAGKPGDWFMDGA